MIEYTVNEAGQHFPALIQAVIAGEQVIVTEKGQAIAQINPFSPSLRKPSLIGLRKGQMKVPDDFDSWPDDVARALGIIE